MTNIENDLVIQKNAVIELINEGEFAEAWFATKLLAGLWETAGYKYKTLELIERLESALFYAMNDKKKYTLKQRRNLEGLYAQVRGQWMRM